MDEPCSALDPIATARIEELIAELRENFTIVIVTHSMQQAARVSQRTAFFHLGELVEVGDTEQIFTNPGDSRTQGHIPGRFGRAACPRTRRGSEDQSMEDHSTATQSDDERTTLLALNAPRGERFDQTRSRRQS